MTRQTILAHIAFMASLEPAYAAKALLWYHRTLPWLDLMPGEAESDKG